MGARALETDVWLTGDGIAVIDHDGVVRRHGRRIPIGTVAHADLPTHLPTLAELQAAVGPTIELSIDVKDDAAAAEVLRVRSAAGPDARRATWLCHPDPRLLAEWRALDPDVRLVASIRRRDLRRVLPDGIEALAESGIDALNMRGLTWTPGLVRRCHAAGLLAFAWNVQGVARMQRLVRWGIDALYSDHTDRLVRALGE
jgi:glycerophosphoryl diester phosphodiesterase